LNATAARAGSTRTFRASCELSRDPVLRWADDAGRRKFDMTVDRRPVVSRQPVSVGNPGRIGLQPE
jgi:hypothetical protein